MGFLEGLLVKLAATLGEMFFGWAKSKASEKKEHYKDSKDMREKSERVERSAEAIRGQLKEHKLVTKEYARALKARNAKLRGGGFFN